jgi:hypothetical protein
MSALLHPFLVAKQTYVPTITQKSSVPANTGHCFIHPRTMLDRTGHASASLEKAALNSSLLDKRTIKSAQGD